MFRYLVFIVTAAYLISLYLLTIVRDPALNDIMQSPNRWKLLWRRKARFALLSDDFFNSDEYKKYKCEFENLFRFKNNSNPSEVRVSS